MSLTKVEILNRRKKRVRYKLQKCNKKNGLRISVFRSNNHFYAQLIDDIKRTTILSVSSLEKKLRDKFKNTKKTQVAEDLGKIFFDRLKKAKVNNVIFDKGGYKYHGRVKAFAESLRKHGISV